MATRDNSGTRSRLAVAGATHDVFRRDRVEGSARLPYRLKVLLKHLLRHEDGRLLTASQVTALRFGTTYLEAHRRSVPDSHREASNTDRGLLAESES